MITSGEDLGKKLEFATTLIKRQKGEYDAIIKQKEEDIESYLAQTAELQDKLKDAADASAQLTQLEQ
jgi:hypothetical protein